MFTDKIMKKWKVVVGASIACLCIAAVAIPAIFGGGGGIRLTIEPEDEQLVEPGATTTLNYVIKVYNYQDTADSFDLFLVRGNCNPPIYTFPWPEDKAFINNVPAGGQKQVGLNVVVVNPTEGASCTFKVNAVSKSNPRLWAPQKAKITARTTSLPPRCIGLMPNLSEPQVVIKDGTKAIKWTTFACDPDEDTLYYRFMLVGPGGVEIRDWSTSNEWIWSATLSDIGNSTIYADVRDGYHATDSTTLDYDDSCVYTDYEIRENQPPTCIDLMPNLSEPQTIMTLNGTKGIKWTVFADDPDDDTIYYRFLLNGPGTGGTEHTEQNWSTSNEWIWVANESDIGNSTIYADVRDGHHADDSTIPDYDDSCVYTDYEILENQPPCCACLMPDPSEPQLNGTQINWTACAIDPEGDRDQLWYRFRVDNSSGWNITRDWDTSNRWTWTPADPGYYDIRVCIRDSYFPISAPFIDHEDVNATYGNYTIT